MTAIAKPQARRRAAKVVRRRQLIDAAIESIAKRGLGDTTLAHVSQAAGLSQGIVHVFPVFDAIVRFTFGNRAPTRNSWLYTPEIS